MLLPGPLFKLQDVSVTTGSNKRKNDNLDGNPEKKYRPVKEQEELDTQLIQWLTQEYERDTNLLFQSQYDILSLTHRTTLVR